MDVIIIFVFEHWMFPFISRRFNNGKPLRPLAKIAHGLFFTVLSFAASGILQVQELF